MSEQSTDQSAGQSTDKTSETSIPPNPQQSETKFKKLQQLPNQLKNQIQKQLKVVKTSTQNTYQQVVDKATATVDHLDAWAVDQVNENIDKVAETVDRSRLEAQAKLQKGLKQTQSTIQQKAKNTGDRLKNAAQSVFKKFKD